MDKKWYFEDHGRAQGPITTRELINKIQKGEMTLIDLVFKEGERGWMPVESFTEITELLGNITHQDAADWIVLRTCEVDGKWIQEQIGPFNAEQILDLIDKGKIRFDDYVWRTGYDKWVPLGRVDQFEKPLHSSVDVDLSLYAVPRQEDLIMESPLKTVKVAVEKVNDINPEIIPEEATGNDLAMPKWAINTELPIATEILEEPKTEFLDEAHIVREESRAKQPHTSIVEKIQKKEDLESKSKLNKPSDKEKIIQIEKLKDRWWHVAVAGGVLAIIFASTLLIWWARKASRTQTPVVSEQTSPVEQKKVASADSVATREVAQEVKEEKGEGSTSALPTESVKEDDKAADRETATTKKNASKNEDHKISRSGFKAKSYYHNKERMFLFYKADEGVRLIDELEESSKKYKKNHKGWSSFYSKWKGKARSYNTYVSKESHNAHLYKSLFKDLSEAASRLESTGKDVNAQMSTQRTPSKFVSLKSIESDFKSVYGKARNLDR